MMMGQTLNFFIKKNFFSQHHATTRQLREPLLHLHRVFRISEDVIEMITIYGYTIEGCDGIVGVYVGNVIV